MLGDYDGNRKLEIVALNGEDYYAVPGQMDYIYKNQNKFNEVLLNINIDGASYIEGKSTFSLFGLPEEMITNKKLAQMKNMANIFVQKNQALAQKHPCWRLDAVCLVLNKNQEIEKINHYENLV